MYVAMWRLTEDRNRKVVWMVEAESPLSAMHKLCEGFREFAEVKEVDVSHTRLADSEAPHERDMTAELQFQMTYRMSAGGSFTRHIVIYSLNNNATIWRLT